ncbi:MAG: class I SAM-dependent methyltransferase [Methanobacteriaceae archaeon]
MKWKKIGRILIVSDINKIVDINNMGNINNNCNSTKGSVNNTNFNEILAKYDVDSIIKVNNISGQMRKPSIEIIAGNTTETIHKENKCLFKLDLDKVMWSKGNVTERMRIANLVNDGEVFFDMFAGIGYFSISVAVIGNPKKVYAAEINPESHHFLSENIKLNKVESNVEGIIGDCSDIANDIGRNKADRVHMGYVKTTHHYLEAGINTLKKGGVLHYHETVHKKEMDTRPIKRVEDVAKKLNRGEIEVLNQRVIKKYSPGVVHTVLDVRIC